MCSLPLQEGEKDSQLEVVSTTPKAASTNTGRMCLGLKVPT